jgi:hypothetical protein
VGFFTVDKTSVVICSYTALHDELLSQPNVACK